MLGRPKHHMHWLGILLALIASDAHAQATGGTSKVITLQPATTNSEVFAGILGEIAKPGVYRLEPNALSLQNVIRRAGGLTDEASGTIRIVRQDRVVESFFFNPQANIALLAGDLLIIESKRTQAAVSKLYEADPRLRAMYANSGDRTDKPSRSGVQVAFVNVLDRPVIVKLKHENAHVGHVVQMLDQPIELAQAVRVIGPERLLSQNNAPQTMDASLADGSVLVFPRNSINRSKLPSLPVPYESEIATGASPAIIGSSPELRNVGQLPPLMARQFDQGARFSQPALEPSTLPAAPASNPPLPAATERLEIPQSTQAPLVSSPPRIATIPFTGERRITSSSRQLSTASDDQHEGAAEPRQPAIREAAADQAARPERKSKSDPKTFDETDDTLLEDEAPTSASGKSSSLSLGMMLGILTLTGLLVGVALLTRRYFDRQRSLAPGLFAEIDAVLHQQSGAPLSASPTVVAAEPSIAIPERHPTSAEPSTSPSASNWFNQLLKNQLPIRQEEAQFPAEIALQGRLIPRPSFRVDAAASPLHQGPHFAADDVLPESEATNETSKATAEQVIDAVDTGHSSRPSKPHFLKRRPGENTIAAAVSAAKASSGAGPTPQPELKNSTTPVADALRHLQGGQQ